MPCSIGTTSQGSIIGPTKHLEGAPETAVATDCWKQWRGDETAAALSSDTDLTQQITALVTYSRSSLGKYWRIWWTHLDSNQGPLACEASALTGLSYASTGGWNYRAARATSQESSRLET